MKNGLDELLDVNSYDPDGKLKFPGKIIAATPKAYYHKTLGVLLATPHDPKLLVLALLLLNNQDVKVRFIHTSSNTLNTMQKHNNFPLRLGSCCAIRP